MPPAAEAAGQADGVPVAANWLGAAGWLGSADGAGPVVPEPTPAAPTGVLEGAEAAGDAVELTVEVTDDAAEVTAEATGDAAEVTAEATGDAAELTVEVTAEAIGGAAEVTVEAVDACVGVRGGSAAAAACAGRENISMIARIPAAASATCTATTAMRRATGCGMSSSHSTRTGPLAYPAAAAANLACPDLLFGHHRTASSRTGQGRDLPQRARASSDRLPDPRARGSS